MIKDLGLRGSIGPVEFYSYVSGVAARSSYFYEESATGISFFSRGNEFTIGQDGVEYSGTGGNFCEYMFGVEKPLKDLLRGEVNNRLIMFGAFLDQTEHVVFTNNTSGHETYQNLFLQGHAVKNYYFFVSNDYTTEVRKRQMLILSTVGKLLKRSELVSDDNDAELVDAFMLDIEDPDATVLMFKLVNKANEEYYNAFREYYFKDKNITSAEEEHLNEIVRKHGIDYYQQERMKIDVMYKHPENRTIVDEYRDILISGMDTDVLKHSEIAGLRRLRTLRVRNNIPSVLFETLDEFLLKGRKIQEAEEAEYLRDARAILGSLFFKDPTLKSHIIKEDIIKLISAKHNAYANGDRGFENILLDIGKACDETARETRDFTLLEEFSSIVTYFDRYDHVQASMSQIAFMQKMEFKEEFLRSLIGNMKEFDELQEGLFYKLFVEGLLTNKYITNFGRKKVRSLYDGMRDVVSGDASIRDISEKLNVIVEEENIYQQIQELLKEKIKSYYSRLDIKEVRDELKDEAIKDLSERGFNGNVPDALFERVFLDLKKESFYLNSLLPQIIKKVDTKLREDFLQNSGLDRFYIESFEKEYFETNELDMFLLNLIREEKEAVSSDMQEFEL